LNADSIGQRSETVRRANLGLIVRERTGPGGNAGIDWSGTVPRHRRSAMGSANEGNVRLRWGVLSTADIARKTWIPGVRRAPQQRGEVVAIASRDQASAAHAAEELGIPRAHGSYEELLADPDVDAVYIPLPNHLHLEWTLAAARAGKHVLCE
jgi:hypothetical protein